jgi:hypothetical protein
VNGLRFTRDIGEVPARLLCIRYAISYDAMRRVDLRIAVPCRRTRFRDPSRDRSTRAALRGRLPRFETNRTGSPLRSELDSCRPSAENPLPQHDLRPSGAFSPDSRDDEAGQIAALAAAGRR